jgi:ethanolamine utilization protein EutP (predicted NTPase)
LTRNREEIVVLSKVDTVDEDTKKKKLKELSKASKKDALELSLFDDEKVKAFGDYLIKILSAK